MNDRRADTSARVQGVRRKTGFELGAKPRRNKTNPENAMLRTLSAALLATALIAGPALAADPTGNAATSPTATTVPAPTHAKHVHKHVGSHKVSKNKLPRHGKLAKTHRRHGVTHAGKPLKAAKATKTNKMTKPSKSTHG